MVATLGHRDFLEKSVFANLDGVRAFCILGVLFHHFMPRSPLVPMTYRGFLGVDMFFVLSGFLIVFLLLKERARTGKISLSNFYIRRTLRIFPLYYLVVFLVGVVAFVYDARSFSWDVYARALPWLLTYTLNWTTVEHPILDVSWSLATEEQFYLVWPGIVALASHRVALGALAVGIVVNLGLAFGVQSELYVMQATFLPILLGVALAHGLHSPHVYASLTSLLGRPWATLTLSGLILLTINIPHDDIGGLHRVVIQCLFVLWLASAVVVEDGVGHRLFRQPFLVRTGQISYGLYLWHMIAYVAATRLFDGIGIALVGIPIAYLLAELSFRFFEMPFLKLKHRFRSGLGAASSAPRPFSR